MIQPLAEQLVETARGQSWVAQFDQADQDLARELAQSLVLISGGEFERRLTTLLVETSGKASGPTAFFAVREWTNSSIPYLDEVSEADAVGPGGDIGSEGRVAAIIRGLCRTDPSRFLNHPSIATMRSARCRLIVLVDDFVGSGDRVGEFHAALWANRSIRSWHSLGFIDFALAAYSSTSKGESRVSRIMDHPPYLVRGCPTFSDLPFPSQKRRTIADFFEIYAQRTEYPSAPFGYGDTGAALVFEHGCPDNVPVIFWADADAGKAWKPLFPARSVMTGEASIFPPELVAPSATATLEAFGQKRLANSKMISRKSALGPEIFLILGLISKRIRKRSMLAHASGLTLSQCTTLIERCIYLKLLTPALRVTDLGHAELAYARRLSDSIEVLSNLGSNDYYPRQLRRSGGS